MNRKKKRDELFAALEVNKQLAKEPKLANWATAFVKAAESAGEDLAFRSVDDAWDSRVASTIRLVCDVWPYCEWSTWLTWQRYGGPRRRGPWWIAEFNYPPRWNNGIMILRNPWRFPFSELLMASDQPGVQFTFQTPRKAQLSKTENKWLVHAVLDGVRYDYEDDEFGLICQKGQRSLGVDIWQRDCLDDALEGNSHLNPTKDDEGIYWYQEQSKSVAKFEKSKKPRRRQT